MILIKVLTKMIKSLIWNFIQFWTVCLCLSLKGILANKEEISIEELEEYPCLAFEQGIIIHSILQRKC